MIPLIVLAAAFSIPSFTLAPNPPIIEGCCGLTIGATGTTIGYPLAVGDIIYFPLWEVGPNSFGDPSVVPLPNGDTWTISNNDPAEISATLGTVNGEPALVVSALVGASDQNPIVTISDTAGSVGSLQLAFNIINFSQ